MDFNIVDTLNTSLGPSMPPNKLEFYAGTHRRQPVRGQRRPLAPARDRPLRARPTSPSAWSSGTRGTRSRPARRAPTSTAASATSSATRPSPGAQVFAGWRPSNERDESRHNIAAYVDVEGDLVPRVRLGLAGRVENYSDFGVHRGRQDHRALQAPRPGGDPRRGQHRLPRPVAGPVQLLGHQHELPEPRPGPGARRGGDVPGRQRARARAGRHRPRARGVHPPERGAGAHARRQLRPDRRTTTASTSTTASCCPATSPTPASAALLAPFGPYRQRAVLHQRHRHPDHGLGPHRGLPDRP